MRYLIALLAACGSTPASTATSIPSSTENASPTEAAPSELTIALEPLAWWLGDWKGAEGQEHWVAAGGAFYGIGLNDTGWEAMIVDDAEGGGPADGIVRFFAMPGGSKSVEFRAEKIDAASALFANAAHDDPKKIGYARTGDALRATLYGDANRTITFDFTRAELPRAPELEQADIAFSNDTHQRGVDGWVAAFAPDGAMMRKSGRITGAEIGEKMKPVLTSGLLAWAPIDSGVRGEIGFTVGKATFTGKTPADSWRSTYVTIWKQQPDKSWKVLFDTGRAVNDPAPK